MTGKNVPDFGVESPAFTVPNNGEERSAGLVSPGDADGDEESKPQAESHSGKRSHTPLMRLEEGIVNQCESIRLLPYF